MPIALRTVSPEVERPAKRSRFDESEVSDPEDSLRSEMSKPIEFVKVYDRELDYRNKLVLAPMVRTGSLPMRLLSLYYGAGLVWSPEVVDKAIIGAERVVDETTGVITYTKGQGPIFSTHPIEKPYLIFQIGSSSPDLALEAARIVQQDVSGIDLNCGCPKPFSTHAGMGAALLSTPDILLGILRNLLENIPLPISCKIRMLPEQSPTLTLVARILRTGIRNLTVHCRTRDMRPRDRAMWERLGDIVELGKQRGVPVICNGDGDGWANWEQIRKATGADSVMIARAAERNPSVFLSTGPKCNVTEVIPKLLNIAQFINNPWGNTKFLLNQFKPSAPPISHLSKSQKKHVQETVNRCKSLDEVAAQLQISLGKGSLFMADLERNLSMQSDDPFEQQHRSQQDDPPVGELASIERHAKAKDGEISVGQPQP